MRVLVRIAVCATLCFLPWIASAHHSLTEWDPNVIVEHFELNEAGDGIAYRIELTDPATFTQTVTGYANWAAVPGIEIRPFAMYCEDNFYQD